MKRLFAFLLLAVPALGCNDPVNPTPDDPSDDDKKEPKQGYVSDRDPDRGPPAGFRIA